jgi:CHAT domain-containing protein/tetratricopeptide (TPR) repeat protein
MRQVLRIVLFFLYVVFVTTSCQSTEQKWASTTIISNEELDEMEITFARFTPPPPQRSIEGIEEIVAEVDFSHKSACAGGGFYEVVLPPKGLQASHEQFNVPFAWRDAANTAFRYGDFDRALGYIDDALTSIPSGRYWIQYRGGMTYSKSVYVAVLGDASGSGAYFSQASAAVGSYTGGFYEYRRNQAWAREAAAINAYAQGRFREAELRLRDVRSAWDGGLWYHSGSLATGDEWVAPNLKIHAISGDVFVNYLLVLSLANQNRLVEAEAEARLNLWRVGDVIDLAWIMDALAVVMLRQGRYVDAEWVSQKMADFFEEKCAPSRLFVVLRTYLRLAHALAAQGKWEQALHYYTRAYSEHDKDASGVLDRLLLESPDWPIAQMLSGDVTGAHETFSKILSRVTLEYGADSYQAKEVVAFDALNSAISSRSQQAFLEDAVTALLETPGATLGNVADLDARERRMSLLVDEYLSLLGVPDMAGSAGRSFRIAQAGRHGTVQSALASSALRARVSDPELRALLRKYQDILNRREEIDRIYAAQATLGTVTYEGPGILQLGAEVQTLEAAKITALARLRTEFPDFARLTDNTPLSAEQVTALLTPGEAVVQLRVTSDYTYVWAINHAGELSMARTPLPSADLERLVGRLRHSVDPGAISTLADIPDFDVQASFSLYEKILAPVRRVWGDARSLIIVSDGALQQVPFSLLVTRAPAARKKGSLRFEEYRSTAWLARSHAVMTLPSLSSLAALRGSTSFSRTDAREFVGFGDPVFSAQQRSFAETAGSTPETLRSATAASDDRITLRALPEMRAVRSASLRDLPPLPDTREELISIARSLGVDVEGSVFLGVHANEQRLFGMDLSNVRILAFATHGLVKGDLDGLNEPALALSSPEVVGDEEGDGLLSLSEIIGLKLNADLVILSACNTASADGSGAEAVSGLGRAFFFAGTKSLLVSHWPVHSAATTSLMAKVFENMSVDSSAGRAEAVRRARIQLIDNGTFVSGGTAAFSYAHPIFWSAFTVVGDGGPPGPGQIR